MNGLRQKLGVVFSRDWTLSQDGLLFLVIWAALLGTALQSILIVPSEKNSSSLVLAPLHVLVADPMPALWLGLLALYIAADVWARGRFQAWGKNIALWGTIFAFVILPTLGTMILRQNSAAHLYIHDGAIQVEQAARFFSSGQNPYQADYSATPMAQWPFYESGLAVNPALWHLPYLPWLWLSTLPFEVFFRNILGWYDVRLVYLLLLIGSLILILQSSLFSSNRFSAAMMLALSPLFVPFFIEGRNDIVVSFWLVAALVLLDAKRLVWAGLAVAAAVASKQTAWFIVPFFLSYIWSRGENKSFWARVKPLVPGCLLVVLLIAPFVLWDVQAFWDDVIAFQSGAGAGITNYPIKSLGFGSLVLGFGLVERNTDVFPFTWFQLLLGLPLFFGLLWIQQRRQQLSSLVLNYALLLTFALFFSRTFNDNHLGFAITWLSFGFLSSPARSNDEIA